MPEVTYVRIVRGTVTDNAVIDTLSVPEWATAENGWHPANRREIGMIDDGTGTFTHPEPKEQPGNADAIMGQYTRKGSPLKYLTDMVFDQAQVQDGTLTREQFDADLRSKVEGG